MYIMLPLDCYMILASISIKPDAKGLFAAVPGWDSTAIFLLC